MKPTLLFDADGVVINAKIFSKHLEDDFGITQEQTSEFFTGVFSSADLGSKKPAAKFYENLLKLIGNPNPSNTWFFDDTPKNITGARAAGLNAEHYTDFQTYEKLVEKEGW